MCEFNINKEVMVRTQGCRLASGSCVSQKYHNYQCWSLFTT